jgi:hypothetical protein
LPGGSARLHVALNPNERIDIERAFVSGSLKVKFAWMVRSHRDCDLGAVDALPCV